MLENEIDYFFCSHEIDVMKQKSIVGCEVRSDDHPFEEKNYLEVLHIDGSLERICEVNVEHKDYRDKLHQFRTRYFGEGYLT